MASFEGRASELSQSPQFEFSGLKVSLGGSPVGVLEESKNKNSNEGMTINIILVDVTLTSNIIF